MPSIARELYDSLTWKMVQQWITESEPEGLHLEFKRKEDPKTPTIDDEDKENLGKALSAFANVEGGLYIIGVQAGGGGKRGQTFDRAEHVVALERAEEFGGALERRLRTLTDPPIAGLQCKAIVPSRGAPGVVAVYVPESDGGPHRVTNATREVNDRYYMRTAGGDQTMPHSLLADRFGRTARPKLRACFELTQSDPDFVVALSITNEGRGVALRPAVLLSRRPHDRTLKWQPAGYFAQGETPTGSTIFEPSLREESRVLIYPEMTLLVATGTANFGRSAARQRGTPDFRFDLGVTLFTLNGQPIKGTGVFAPSVFDWEDPGLEMPRFYLPELEP